MARRFFITRRLDIINRLLNSMNRLINGITRLINGLTRLIIAINDIPINPKITNEEFSIFRKAKARVLLVFPILLIVGEMDLQTQARFFTYFPEFL